MLRVHDIDVRYGSIVAVRDAALTLDAGTLQAVVGPNGAGKTSLFAGIAGLVPAEGIVELRGERIDGLAAEKRAAVGLASVPPGRRLFGRLSVEQNLVVGATVLPRARAGDAVEETLDRFPMLAERRGQRADTLSGGEGQLLMIARALVARPAVLLVDEPFQGLSEDARELVGGALRAAADEGAAIAVASPDPIDGVPTLEMIHGSLGVRV